MRDYESLSEVAKKVTLKISQEIDRPNNNFALQKPKIKVSRYKKEIKAVEISTFLDLKDYLKQSGIPVDLFDLPREEELEISGKYKAKMAVLIKNVNNVGNVGDQFFVVNTYTEKGSIKTKDLAPEKFGLTSKKYKTKQPFDNDLVEGVKKLLKEQKIFENQGSFLLQSYNLVAKEKSSKSTIEFDNDLKNLFKSLKPQDIQAIGKDFGEILSLRWYINQIPNGKLKQFFFSEISNEPLVDYTIETSEGLKKVSAKYEEGAAHSIKAIVSGIDKAYKKPNQKEITPITVLKILGSVDAATEKSNVSTKILKSYEILNNEPYKILCKTLKKTKPSLNDINDFIQKIADSSTNLKNRIDLFKKIFAEFYKVLGKNASDDSLSTVFKGNTYKKYYSLLLSPMGYALVDFMNKENEYQKILNATSRMLDVDQVYLFIKPNGMSFETKQFKEAKFKFNYGANAKDSDNTGIKFSMR